VLFKYFQHGVSHISPMSPFAGYFGHEIRILEGLEGLHCSLMGDLESFGRSGQVVGRLSSTGPEKSACSSMPEA